MPVPLRDLEERLPEWLRPVLFVFCLLLGFWLLFWILALLSLSDLSRTNHLMVVGGGAAVVGSLCFGLLRQYVFTSLPLKVWCSWPMSLLVGASAMLPITDLVLGRELLGVSPPSGWLLLCLLIPTVLGVGFAYVEWKERGHSHNTSLERTREG
jgi:hypothetical protein